MFPQNLKDEYDTSELQQKLLQIKPFLEKEIKKNKDKRKKTYSITKLALLVDEFPEIIRILVLNGKIKGAFKDKDNIWVISQEEVEDILKKPTKKEKICYLVV
jgi:hypothetical protein